MNISPQGASLDDEARRGLGGPVNRTGADRHRPLRGGLSARTESFMPSSERVIQFLELQVSSVSYLSGLQWNHRYSVSQFGSRREGRFHTNSRKWWHAPLSLLSALLSVHVCHNSISRFPPVSLFWDLIGCVSILLTPRACSKSSFPDFQ